MEANEGSPQPAERLLATADRLFYAEGIRAVGIDRILAESRVAKATLYAHFRTKEDLVAKYLHRRSDATRTRVTQVVEARAGQSPTAQILAGFEVFDELLSEQGFRGCPFANASAEYPHHAGIQAAIADDRAWLPALFSGVLEPVAGRAGSGLATALVQLYDGAIAGAHLDRAPDSAITAARTARALLATYEIP